MNAQFHTPSFGDEVFDLGDTSASTPNSNMVAGTSVNNNSYMYQQQTPLSITQTKRMVSLHNTSDEYHTANEESFNVTANNSMNNSIIQQNTHKPNNILQGQTQQQLGGNGTPTSSTTAPPTTMAARKQMLPLDQSEPAKPLSAYALFFRDTVSAIKQQNPTCSFQELSKIVASMWDALDPVHKCVYNKKNELARTEYLKQMRVYQQQQQQKQELLNQTNANALINTPQTTKPPYSSPQSTTPQQAVTPTNINNNQPQQMQQTQVINNNNNVIANTNSNNNNSTATANTASAAPTEEQIRLLTEAGSVQKCTRENCNKRAIINPDWEDEYCSNECVVIHCRNVFNAWVQSNLEAKQQQVTTTAQQQQTTTT